MQINRLFELIYLLLNKQSITAKELSVRFEVSPRTIYRDVELLSSAGIPIYMTKGKGGGISLLSDFVLNKAVLTETEKVDILTALRALEAINLEQTNSVLQKLSSLFGNTNPDWIEVDFSGWGDAAEEAKLFAILKSSIVSKQRAEFLYHSADDSMRRVVEPMKLCFKGQGWYLYAFCTMRNDFRFFKLRRIKEINVLNETFQRLAPSKVFDSDNAFNDDFVTITLKLSKEMAYRAYDAVCESLPDGNFIARINVPRGDWVYHYIATFGEHCEILEPEDIRLQIKDKLQKTLQIYL